MVPDLQRHPPAVGNGSERRPSSWLRAARATAMTLAALSLTIVLASEPAAACYVNLTPYPNSTEVNNGYTFVWGQLSQGGNYYYGTYGLIRTTSPADPRDSSTPDNAYMHVNAYLANEQSGTGTPNCCWSNTGWYVGYGRNGTVETSPTAYAELVDDSGAGGSINWVFTVGDPATSNLYYETIQNGLLPNGRYRHDAYWYYGGVWKFGGYSELTVATTMSAAAGEATNAISATGQRDQCKPESAGGDNVLSSLSLYVSGSGWVFWNPANGRYADLVLDPPYHRTAITDYTDQGVGGP
jgi:hypothetical protein